MLSALKRPPMFCLSTVKVRSDADGLIDVSSKRKRAASVGADGTCAAAQTADTSQTPTMAVLIRSLNCTIDSHDRTAVGLQSAPMSKPFRTLIAVAAAVSIASVTFAQATSYRARLSMFPIANANAGATVKGIGSVTATL